MKARILVTGANGFIGTTLCKYLGSRGFEVIAALRQHVGSFSDMGIRTVSIGSVDGRTDWSNAVSGVDIVVHLAGRAHIVADGKKGSIQAYRQVNAAGTRNLAEQAARAKVKRFIYLSSVKVNGEESKDTYHENSEPSPADVYGLSKLEGEVQLKIVAHQSGMEGVIIRPPLVYGPGVKANFLSLMRLIKRNIPLPLAGIKNQRSFIYIGNLVDCIHTCITRSAAANQTYLVSDDKDVSTSELVRLIASALGCHVRLFPFPQSLLRSVIGLTGKDNTLKRLFGSLTVNVSKIKSELSWTPPYSVESGLMDTAEWFNLKVKP